MSDDIVTLTSDQWGMLRESIGEIRADLKALRAELMAIQVTLAKQDERLRKVEAVQQAQGGMARLGQFVLATGIALAALVLSIIGFLKRLA